MSPSKWIDAKIETALADAISVVGASPASGREEDTEPSLNELPIVRIANTVIQQALVVRASDVHLEPELKDLRIRFRVDGVLYEAMRMPKYIQLPLIERFKVMAELDRTERRLPQVGHIGIGY